MKPLQIKVLSAGTGCERGFKPGDTWELTDNCIPAGFCIGAMSALLPWLTARLYDAQLPWAPDNTLEVTCTDRDNAVVFEIRNKA